MLEPPVSGQECILQRRDPQIQWDKGNGNRQGARASVDGVCGAPVWELGCAVSRALSQLTLVHLFLGA